MIWIKTKTNYRNQRAQVLDTWKFILDTTDRLNCVKFSYAQNKPINIFFARKYISFVYAAIVDMVIQTSHQRILSHNKIIPDAPGVGHLEEVEK